jgi:hypothetical protein
MPQKKELALGELLAITADSLSQDAAYLRVMSLGRPENEVITLIRAADKISRLGDRLGVQTGHQRRKTDANDFE